MAKKFKGINRVDILKGILLSVVYYILGIVASSLWLTGGSSLFYAENPILITAIPSAVFLSFFVVFFCGMGSCKKNKEKSQL